MEERDVIQIKSSEPKIHYQELQPHTYQEQFTAQFIHVPPSCRYCANHPSNGGSGICGCVLGTQTIY